VQYACDIALNMYCVIGWWSGWLVGECFC